MERGASAAANASSAFVQVEGARGDLWRGGLECAAGLAGIALVLWLSHGNEAIDLQRFPLCWAGVLLALHGALRVRHGSAALPGAAALLLAGVSSVLFWDLFELLNLRLCNWWYTGLPGQAWLGGLFSALSFATVLPAALLGERLLRPRLWYATGAAAAAEAGAAAAAGPAARTRPTANGSASSSSRPAAKAAPLALLGAGMLGLALLFPRYAFGFAWVFLWPIGEALLVRWGPPPEGAQPSPLEAWRAGDRGPALRLCALALPLGLTWEALNYGCARGWVYTVPFFEGHKLFEMPLPGYGGYLPFLLECGAMLALLSRLPFALRRSARARRLCGLGLALLVPLHLGVDGLGRELTGVSRVQPLSDARSLSEAARAELGRRGISSPEQALRLPVDSGSSPGLSPEAWQEVRDLAALALTAHLGIANAERLRSCGCRSVAELARADWFALWRCQEDLPGPSRAASRPALLRLWIGAAQRASPQAPPPDSR